MCATASLVRGFTRVSGKLPASCDGWILFSLNTQATFVKQLSRPMTKELVESHLDLEARHLGESMYNGKTLQTYLVLLQQIVICIADKGVLLGASVAGAQNISKTDILKALILEA